MKAVKHIPAGKIKKMLFPISDGGESIKSNDFVAMPSSPLRSLASQQQQPSSLDPSVRVTHFESFHRLVPNQNHTNNNITNNITISTNGRPKSPPPKSDILIKRNHLKNFTMRKVNVVRSTPANDDGDTKADSNVKIYNNNNSKTNNIKRSVQFTINNNSKDRKNLRSLKTLIADLEN